MGVADGEDAGQGVGLPRVPVGSLRIPDGLTDHFRIQVVHLDEIVAAGQGEHVVGRDFVRSKLTAELEPSADAVGTRCAGATGVRTKVHEDPRGSLVRPLFEGETELLGGRAMGLKGRHALWVSVVLGARPSASSILSQTTTCFGSMPSRR